MMKLQNKKFTLFELLIIVAIIAILVSILLPSLEKARERSRRAVCLSNVAQVGRALTEYGKDNSYSLPKGANQMTDDNGTWLVWNQKANSGSRRFGLGHIIEQDRDADEPGYMDNYIDQGDIDILYCPSWEHPYIKPGYRNTADIASYSRNHVGGWPTTKIPNQWNNDFPKSWSYVSYDYRATILDDRYTNGTLRGAHLSKDDNRTALIADHWSYKTGDADINDGLGAGMWAHKDSYSVFFMDGGAKFKIDSDRSLMHLSVPHGQTYVEIIWNDFLSN
jgi:type II secretory pathway pseudopilin PulG